MLQKFQEYVDQHKLFDPKSKVLLAVSGGMDSMVMLDLFHEAGFRFDVAHCNFKLRGEESNQDAYFVQQQVIRHGCEYHERSFDTSKYAKDHSLSIQMAARELRYDWFEQLVKEHGYCGYATAHHKDDMVETFLINLVRGTGIKGMSGMQPRLGNKIRPLLFAGREEIEAYRSENHILFREDSSNQDIKYLRNSIRIQILPLLKKLNPAFSENLLQTMDNLKSVEAIYLDYINKAYENCIETQDKDAFRISLEQLSREDQAEACLFAFLQPYGFNAEVIRNICQSLQGSSGKVFMSPSHRLLLDRKHLIVEPLKDNKDSSIQYYIDKNTKVIEEPLAMEVKKKDPGQMKIEPSPLIAYIDHSKVKFPLIIRRWKEGDFFYPIGMEGKKKISDFLIDLKIPVFDKERIWLLCSEDEIVWVIGLRLDDRFKISSNTSEVLRIEVRY